MRTTSAHGVQFIADQEQDSYAPPPCSGNVCPTETVSSSDMFPNGMTITTGISEDSAFWKTQAEFNITLGGEGVFKPDTNSVLKSNSLDNVANVENMTDRQLRDEGILKVHPGRNNRTSLQDLPESQARLAEAFGINQRPEEGPFYLTTMPIDVQVNAVGGSLKTMN